MHQCFVADIHGLETVYSVLAFHVFPFVLRDAQTWGDNHLGNAEVVMWSLVGKDTITGKLLNIFGRMEPGGDSGPAIRFPAWSAGNLRGDQEIDRPTPELATRDS